MALEVLSYGPHGECENDYLLLDLETEGTRAIPFHFTQTMTPIFSVFNLAHLISL